MLVSVSRRFHNIEYDSAFKNIYKKIPFPKVKKEKKRGCKFSAAVLSRTADITILRLFRWEFSKKKKKLDSSGNVRFFLKFSCLKTVLGVQEKKIKMVFL